MRYRQRHGMGIAGAVATALVAPALGWIGLMLIPYEKVGPLLRDRLVLGALVAVATGFLLGALQPRLWWLFPILSLAWIPPYLLLQPAAGNIAGDWTMAPITAVVLVGWLSVCLLAAKGASIRFGRGQGQEPE